VGRHPATAFAAAFRSLPTPHHTTPHRTPPSLEVEEVGVVIPVIYGTAPVGLLVPDQLPAVLALQYSTVRLPSSDGPKRGALCTGGTRAVIGKSACEAGAAWGGWLPQWFPAACKTASGGDAQASLKIPLHWCVASGTLTAVHCQQSSTVSGTAHAPARQRTTNSSFCARCCRKAPQPCTSLSPINTRFPCPSRMRKLLHCQPSRCSPVSVSLQSCEVKGKAKQTWWAGKALGPAGSQAGRQARQAGRQTGGQVRNHVIADKA
jgi:hypothetical protein